MRHPLLLAIATPLAEATVFTDSATLKTKVVEWVSNNNCCDAQIEDWDVSQITDMSGPRDTYGNALGGFFPTDFNGDISKWDTASVTTFELTVRDSPLRLARSEQCRAAIEPVNPRVVGQRREAQRDLVVRHRARIVLERDAHVGAVGVASSKGGRKLVDEESEAPLRLPQHRLVQGLRLRVGAALGELLPSLEDPQRALVHELRVGD